MRGQLGFELQGDSLLEMRQALFYSAELFDAIGIGKGRHYHFADDVNSFIIVQDDKQHFSLHATVKTDEEDAGVVPATHRRRRPFDTLYIGAGRSGSWFRAACSRAACSSPATPRTSSSRPADSG